MVASSPSEDERQQLEELAKQLKEKGFSTEFEIAKTAANATSTTVTLHYNGKPIVFPYYERDILQTAKELEDTLINIAGVDRKTAQLFIIWFTNEVEIRRRNVEEEKSSSSASASVGVKVGVRNSNCAKSPTGQKTVTVTARELVVVFPRTIDNSDDVWSLGHLEDRLIIDLLCAKTATVTNDPIVKHYPELKNNIECQHIIFEDKYREQAKRFMRRIPVYKSNPPEFLIYVSDISPRILLQLTKLKAENKSEYDRVVCNAIDRVCEEMDYEYYLRSAKGLPKRFRFVEDENKVDGEGFGKEV